MRQVSLHLISCSAILAAGLTLSATAGAEDLTTTPKLAKDNPNFYATEAWAQADGNVAAGEKIFKEGIGAVPACITCHQENAVGSDDLGAPRLAGQYFSYLMKQLSDFGSDRRKDDIMFTMNTVAKGLSEQNRRDVASYLSDLRVPFKGSDLEALKKNGQVSDVGEIDKMIAKGETLVKWGAGDRGIPACKSCHGYNGRGAPPIFPMIGQQRYVYLESQLKSWREGAQESIVPAPGYVGKMAYKHGDNKLGWLSSNPESVCKKGRCNDPMAAMRKVAVLLTDQDIADAAAYLTTSMSFAPGDLEAPYPNLVNTGSAFVKAADGFRTYDPNDK